MPCFKPSSFALRAAACSLALAGALAAGLIPLPARAGLGHDEIAGLAGDAKPLSYNDPRVVAVVAGVPLAADFDLASLARPRAPLALVTARQDRWLIPAFHGDAVLAVCQTCERLADLADAGHSALLSPLPPGFTGLEAAMLNDPPGFDRSQMAAVDQRIAGFFSRHLLP